MKTMIVVILSAMLSPAFALSCGGKLVRDGMPYHQVKELCNIEHEYTVNNNEADVKRLYDKSGGREHEIIVIDGQVTSVDGSR